MVKEYKDIISTLIYLNERISQEIIAPIIELIKQRTITKSIFEVLLCLADHFEYSIVEG
jgi:hypothetical protein